MYTVKLKNNKSFKCDDSTTIFEAAKKNNIILEHSCLSARCRSCVVKVISGSTINKNEEFVLTEDEKNENYILSCNTKPLSNIEIDVEDLGNINLYEKKIVPCKINSISYLNDEVIDLSVRIPPNSNFKFNSGQYVNLIKGGISRSYSIANSSDHNNELSFYIKNYKNGQMSKYLFSEAKINDLLRIEGPIGTFFLRETSVENLIFLATGTGIGPIKSILDELENNTNEFSRNIWLFFGVRFRNDFFWQPSYNKLNINYIPVLSREDKTWNGEKGYIQDILINRGLDLFNSQVYACGSSDMINSAKEILIKNNLKESNFFSDAFVQTN